LLKPYNFRHTVLDASTFSSEIGEMSLFLFKHASEKDKVKAKQDAEEAKKLATCDGPPYYYKVAYEEAERFFKI